MDIYTEKVGYPDILQGLNNSDDKIDTEKIKSNFFITKLINGVIRDETKKQKSLKP